MNLLPRSGRYEVRCEPGSGALADLTRGLSWANRRHRACAPLESFLSEDLAFTRKGQSEHDPSVGECYDRLDAVLARMSRLCQPITHQILYSPKLPRR